MNARGRASHPRSKSVEIFFADLARKRGDRSLAKRILIVCEDDKSSPNYFKSLVLYLRLSAASVAIVGSDGKTQPIQVVNRAIELNDGANAVESGTEPYDEVWAVIDGDYGNKIPPARDRAQAGEVELAITTPCFEYWVLLHFEDFRRSQLDCSGIIKQLKKHLPQYDKGKENFSNLVKDYKVAAKRARDGRQTQSDELPENISPCSELYLFTESIDKSIADSKPK